MKVRDKLRQDIYEVIPNLPDAKLISLCVYLSGGFDITCEVCCKKNDGFCSPREGICPSPTELCEMEWNS